MTEAGSQRHVLVIGASGNTGSRVVRRLAEQGRPVVAVSHRESTRHYIPKLESVRVFEADAAHPPDALLEAAMDSCGIISCAHIGVTADFARALAHRAKSEGREPPPLVGLSSTRIYSKHDADGTRAGVESGEAAIRASGLRAILLRPTMIFGGGRDANIEVLLRWLERHRWIVLPGRGDARIQPVHAEDVAAAAVAAHDRLEELTTGDHRVRIVDVGGRENRSFESCVRDLAAALQKSEPRIIRLYPWVARIAARIWSWGRLKSALPRLSSIARFSEDRSVDISEANQLLEFDPPPFAERLRLTLQEREAEAKHISRCNPRG